MKPVDKNLTEAERTRLTGKVRATLARLRKGPALNVELVTIGGLRAPARIHDLRRSGYTIDSECLRNGLWKYTLTGCPEEAK